ncbi:MAG: hypothetical protein ACRDZM_00470 [Acidimicrobiia bacterium]
MAGTLAGVAVGQGPVDTIIETFDHAYRPADRDTGWGPNDCFGVLTHRYVISGPLAVDLEEVEGSRLLLGYGYRIEPGASVETSPEVIELPGGSCSE